MKKSFCYIFGTIAFFFLITIVYYKYFSFTNKIDGKKVELSLPIIIDHDLLMKEGFRVFVDEDEPGWTKTDYFKIIINGREFRDTIKVTINAPFYPIANIISFHMSHTVNDRFIKYLESCNKEENAVKQLYICGQDTLIVFKNDESHNSENICYIIFSDVNKNIEYYIIKSIYSVSWFLGFEY